MLIDQSGDGIEDWIIRNEGNSFIWIRDENQDGLADFRIHWESVQKLSSVEYFPRDYNFSCYYYDYPHVDHIKDRRRGTECTGIPLSSGFLRFAGPDRFGFYLVELF